MTQLTLSTAGESHGPQLTAILTGMPAGLTIERSWINQQLARRQSGYGRSDRQRIESDEVVVTAGIRHGVTLGSPIAVQLTNRDHAANWNAVMNPWSTDEKQGNWRDREIHVPRPGHADLAGIARHDYPSGLRNVLERASARETAIRVAAGAIAQQLLAELGIRVRAWVRATGAVSLDIKTPAEEHACWDNLDCTKMRTVNLDADQQMLEQVDAAKRAKDTVGGEVEVIVWGLPPGLGGFATNLERLDGRLARVALSVHAMKGIYIGDAHLRSAGFGSKAHDEIYPVSDALEGVCAGDLGGDQGMGVTRLTNYAGGLEGGMTNGAPVVMHTLMKPLPTLMRPLDTVDLQTGQPATAHAERSDTCAISAAAIVLECAVALEIAAVIREQFGGPAFSDVTAAFASYKQRVLYPFRKPIKLA